MSHSEPEPLASSAALVERDGELATLEAVVAEAVAGQGRTLLIEGPAGIGKTRLLDAVRGHAATARATTLTAHGGEFERDFPFAVVRQLLEGAAAARGDAAFGGAAAAARAVLGPPAEAPSAEGEGATFAVLHGLFWLVLDLAAERPLVLCVDDLHWCDHASLRFLAYLARRLEDQPVLLACTLRTAEPAADAGLLAEVVHAPGAVAVRPGPLSDDAVAALATVRLGGPAAPAFVQACTAATGGNPLLLGQLLAALQDEGVAPEAAQAPRVREIGPRAVSRSVLLRLERLGPVAHAVARAVAVLGEAADAGAVAELAGLDERGVAPAVQALVRADLLVDDAPLRFAHPLLRAAVYHDMGAGGRALEHTRAAEILRRRGAPGERVATHLLAVPARGEAGVALELQEAGRVALRRGAVDSAITFLARAWAEPPAPQDAPRVAFELGMAEWMVDARASVEHLQAARAGLEDPVLRGIATVGLTRSLLFSGMPEEASALAARASAEIAEDTGPELQDTRQALQALAVASTYFGSDTPEARRRSQDIVAARSGGGPGAKMLAGIQAYELMREGRPAAEHVALAYESLEGDVMLEADDGFVVVGAIVAIGVGDDPGTMAQWERLEAQAHRRGSLFAQLANLLWGGWSHLREGDLPEAEDRLRQALATANLYGVTGPGLVYERTFITQTLLERGDVAAARAMFDQAVAHPGPAESTYLYLGVSAALLQAEGRPAEALAVATQLERAVDGLDAPGWVSFRAPQAAALLALGREAEGIALLRKELARSREHGAPATVGRALRLLGSALPGASGLAELREAVAVLEGSQARLERARALAALGSALRRDRQVSEARDPLRRALDLADACGAPGLVEDVRTELAATGVRPRATALAGPGALTASERRVADLAAEGRSNREIAQVLYVTPKTVEVHLSAAYRKLGIASRRGLPAALATA